MRDSGNMAFVFYSRKLIDFFPEGRAFNNAERTLRARFREGLDRKVWMNGEEVYKLTIDMQATARYFAPGHQIRLEVSSSNFPRFDRNLNTGGNNYDETEWVMASNRVYHSDQSGSFLLLPIVNQ
jgi:putative CocE/NonD family hydrolase